MFKNDLSELTDRQQQQGIFNRRAILSFFVVVLMSLGLWGTIAYLQILQHEKYQDLAQQNRVQQQPVAPPRGLLYDRKGRLIASNQPVKNLVLVKERIADMKATLNVLRTLVDLSDEEIERFEKTFGAASPSVSGSDLAL